MPSPWLLLSWWLSPCGLVLQDPRPLPASVASGLFPLAPQHLWPCWDHQLPPRVLIFPPGRSTLHTPGRCSAVSAKKGSGRSHQHGSYSRELWQREQSGSRLPCPHPPGLALSCWRRRQDDPSTSVLPPVCRSDRTGYIPWIRCCLRGRPFPYFRGLTILLSHCLVWAAPSPEPGSLSQPGLTSLGWDSGSV